MSECGCHPDKGHTHPRLWTPPAADLTPETSDGYRLIEFAELLGLVLLPWQKWFFIHALELKPGTDPKKIVLRFRTVLLIIARQNGKTSVAGVWILYGIFLQNAKLTVAAAHNKETAEELWESVTSLIKFVPELNSMFVQQVLKNGREATKLTNNRIYLPVATQNGIGRGKSAHRIFLDELREHKDFSVWAAITKAATAISRAQILAASSAGNQHSVVLSHLRNRAISALDDPKPETRLALFEWSAEPHRSISDREGWREANPCVGELITWETVEDSLTQDPPDVIRTESLGQWVVVDLCPIDMVMWGTSADLTLDLSESVKSNTLYGVVDISPDSAHISLVVAGRIGAKVGVSVIRTWQGVDAFAQMDRDIKHLIKKLRLPTVRVLAGHGETMLPYLRAYGVGVGVLGRPSIIAACKTLAERVQAGELLHDGSPILTEQLQQAIARTTSDGWRFGRTDSAYVDTAYAAAGAVYLCIEKTTASAKRGTNGTI